MQVDANLIKKLRSQKGWTQQQLADIANVSLRTIQRIESEGSASNESVSALSAGFEVSREMLLLVPRVTESALKPANLNVSFLVVFGALAFGVFLGALSTYWLMN